MADIATLREGIKLARRLARSDAFAKFTGEEIFPGIECQSDSDLDDYIRNVSNQPCTKPVYLCLGGMLSCTSVPTMHCHALCCTVLYHTPILNAYVFHPTLFTPQTVHSNNSLCGTCKMGPRSDTLSVVGSDLKVHGIKGTICTMQCISMYLQT